jgi:hypothetical protein
MTPVDISGRETKANISDTKLKSLKQTVKARMLGMRIKRKIDSGGLINLTLLWWRIRRVVCLQITTKFGTSGTTICVSC